MSSTIWIPLLPSLTASHRVVMLDRVGDLNKSRATAPVPSSRRVVEWMRDALDTIGIDRAALVGESIGGWMATHFAMAHPQRVDKMALLGPASITSNQHVKWIAKMGFALRVRPTVNRVERALDTTVMPTTRARLRENPWRPISEQFIIGTPSFRFSWREPRPMRCDSARLATSDIRVLVLVPRYETLHDGPTMADRFRKRLPRARVVLVDDANHLLPIDRPELVADELERFHATT
jgi:pimeloyl-ACP methyl ester carboxylesterase